MPEFGIQLQFWHWLVLAVLLTTIEVFAPGTYFVWMGVSAALVGLLLWFMPALGWELQVLCFALLSLTSVVLWRYVQKRHPLQTEQPLLNRRGEQYVGRVFTLQEPIVNGHGKIRVDDSIWKVQGEDCDAGTRVVVSSTNGVVLMVDRHDS